MEHVDAGEFHHALGVDLDRLTRAFGGEKAKVFGTEFLLQRGEVGLHAPTGAVVDEHETMPVDDATTGGRTQDDAAALVVGLFLEVAGLDELAVGQAADDIEEAERE